MTETNNLDDYGIPAMYIEFVCACIVISQNMSFRLKDMKLECR